MEWLVHAGLGGAGSDHAGWWWCVARARDFMLGVAVCLVSRVVEGGYGE